MIKTTGIVVAAGLLRTLGLGRVSAFAALKSDNKRVMI
jgi:hypothetical protein